jgi:hypothetical protein
LLILLKKWAASGISLPINASATKAIAPVGAIAAENYLILNKARNR